MEPVAYELGPLQWARHRRKIQSQEDVQLAHTILDNEIDDLADLSDIRSDIEPQTVASTLTYVASHAVYLGQVSPPFCSRSLINSSGGRGGI